MPSLSPEEKTQLLAELRTALLAELEGGWAKRGAEDRSELEKLIATSEQAMAERRAEALGELDEKLREAIRKVEIAEAAKLPATIISMKGSDAEPGPALLKVIDDHVEARVKRATQPWINFASIIGALVAAGLVIFQLYSAGRSEADVAKSAGRVAETSKDFAVQRAADIERIAEQVKSVFAKATELENKKGEADAAIAVMKAQGEFSQNLVADAQRRLGTFEDNHRAATAAATRAKESLEEAQSSLERAYFAFGPTIQRLLEVIAQYPESKNVLDLQGVPIGGVVVLSKKEAQALLTSEHGREQPSWCEADGQTAPPDSAFARSAQGRKGIPDLRDLTEPFVKTYGPPFIPEVTFVIRINP